MNESGSLSSLSLVLSLVQMCLVGLLASRHQPSLLTSPILDPRLDASPEVCYSTPNLFTDVSLI